MIGTAARRRPPHLSFLLLPFINPSGDARFALRAQSEEPIVGRAVAEVIREVIVSAEGMPIPEGAVVVVVPDYDEIGRGRNLPNGGSDCLCCRAEPAHVHKAGIEKGEAGHIAG